MTNMNATGPAIRCKMYKFFFLSLENNIPLIPVTNNATNASAPVSLSSPKDKATIKWIKGKSRRKHTK